MYFHFMVDGRQIDGYVTGDAPAFIEYRVNDQDMQPIQTDNQIDTRADVETIVRADLALYGIMEENEAVM